MKIGFHYNNIKNESRLHYVLDFITSHPLNRQAISFAINEKLDVNIYYTKESPIFGLHIKPQEIFFDNKVERKLYANRYLSNDQVLYSVEPVKKEEQSLEKDQIFRFDILETLFFHISRIEEVDVPKNLLSERGQIVEEDLFSVKEGIEKAPVVDQLVFTFLQIMDSKTSAINTTYKLTHDIDFIRKYKSPLSFIRLSLSAIIRGNFIETCEQYFSGIFQSHKDPYNNFDYLLAKNGNIEKTIFFLVGGRHKYDNIYSLNDPIFRTAISTSKERGYTIGIHPSYESWKSDKIIQKEKAKLSTVIDEEIKLSRQHYLHFDIEETPSLLLDAGITDDYSIGYTNRIGFKCGTGFPYFLYDFKKEKTSSLRETPLVLMDSAAINEAKQSQLVLADLIEGFLLTNLENTCITFNFHNSRFDSALPTNKSLVDIYTKIIERIGS